MNYTRTLAFASLLLAPAFACTQGPWSNPCNDPNTVCDPPFPTSEGDSDAEWEGEGEESGWDEPGCPAGQILLANVCTELEEISECEQNLTLVAGEDVLLPPGHTLLSYPRTSANGRRDLATLTPTSLHLWVDDAWSETMLASEGAVESLGELDLDDDEIDEIVMVSQLGDNATRVELWRGDGEGLYAPDQDFDFTGVPSLIQRVDAEADGDLDLLVGTSSEYHLLRNEGGELFAELPASPPPPGANFFTAHSLLVPGGQAVFSSMVQGLDTWPETVPMALRGPDWMPRALESAGGSVPSVWADTVSSNGSLVELLWLWTELDELPRVFAAPVQELSVVTPTEIGGGPSMLVSDPVNAWVLRVDELGLRCLAQFDRSAQGWVAADLDDDGVDEYLAPINDVVRRYTIE